MKRIALLTLLAASAAARAGTSPAPPAVSSPIPLPVVQPPPVAVPPVPAPRPAPAGAAVRPSPAVPDVALGVRGSKHDLSKGGPGPVKAVRETDPCIFCHVSHHGSGLGNNRPDSKGLVQPYSSSTMASRAPERSPTGATRICLSCHDGTIALGRTRTRDIAMAGTTNGLMPAGASNLGTDLRGTHPVSFQGAASPKVHDPPKGDPVRLDRKGELQCTACHDPHREYVDRDHGKFLVKTTRSSALCLACHTGGTYQPAGAVHASSQATAAQQQLATSNASDRTLAAAGCLACHPSHGGDRRGRMVKQAAGDDANCLSCHDGSVATDVASLVTLTSAHAAPRAAASAHDAAEGPRAAAKLPETSPAAPRHVTCVDCHDPHATGTGPASATAPDVPSALARAWGIDRNGQRVSPVRYEYEVCFKCHADSQNQPQAKGSLLPGEPRRAVTEVNLRRAFDPGAPSFHPVVSAGRSADVPSLVAPLTPRSQIYCGDCHGSQESKPAAQALAQTPKVLATRALATASATAPAPAGTNPSIRTARGPHGSPLEHLLSRPYATADGTVEGPSAYALCYKCHDRGVLLSASSSFPLHSDHVAAQSAPCSACHGAHGVSALAGNPVNNAHLVDFDVSIVKASRSGLRRYTSRGPRAGSCTLMCHGKEHVDAAYGAAAAASPLRALRTLGAPRLPLAPAMKPREQP